MSERIGKSQLQGALRYLHRAALVAEGTFSLEMWAPGDGVTRYRIEGPAGRNPFGSRYWLGASEAYYGIQSIAAGIEWADNDDRRRLHQEAS